MQYGFVFFKSSNFGLLECVAAEVTPLRLNLRGLINRRAVFSPLLEPKAELYFTESD